MSAAGSIGDLLPYVAVGAELTRRGHAVTLVANAHFEPLARNAGLAFVAAATEADHQKFLADATLWEPSVTSLETARHRHYYPHLGTYCRAVLERCTGRSAIVSSEAGGWLAAERLGIPFGYLACAPALSMFTQSRHDPAHPEQVLPAWARWFAADGRRLSMWYRLSQLRGGAQPPSGPPRLSNGHPVAQLRTALGLPRAATFDPRPAVAIGMWPDWFAPPQPDWPREAIVAGFAFYPPPTGAAADRSARCEGSAPVVVTTGSVAGSQHGFYRTAVDACEGLGRPAVLVSPHRNHIPADLPSNVQWRAHAPFGDLFAGASLVVHHGGIGTAAYALAAGVPQIVMPMRWDQFDNGNRLERLGVGRMLSPKTTSARTLRGVIVAMLRSHQVAERCRHWSSQVDAGSGVRRAADAVEARCCGGIKRVGTHDAEEPAETVGRAR